MMTRCLFWLPLLVIATAIPGAAQEDSYLNAPAPDDEDPIYSGFIRKGDLTGNLDKLLNVNLFMAARVSQIDNNDIHEYYAGTDVDNIGIPGARIYLTGQAFTDLFYKIAYEFSNENDLDRTDRNGRLTDAIITWRLPFETDLMNRLDFNVGLAPIFLSPAAVDDLFFIDTIEYPLIVQNMLPPGTARDKGVFFKGSFFERETVQLWAGMFNGTHRAIGPTGAVVSPAVDAWGTSPGQDVDQFAYMGRVQVNVLNEEQFFFMVSGGASQNSVQEVTPNRRIDDRLYDLASELRFNERKTWINGELIRTRTEHVPDMWGFHVTAGHRLSFIDDRLEVLARYEKQKLDDRASSLDDLWSTTFGVNWFFDPEHEHDAKVQLNYVTLVPKRTGLARPFDFEGDNALLLQFVVGF